MGVHDILNLGSTAEIPSNIILHIAHQCKNYGVKEASISSVTCTTLLNSDLINDVNNAPRSKCQTFVFWGTCSQVVSFSMSCRIAWDIEFWSNVGSNCVNIFVFFYCISKDVIKS